MNDATVILLVLGLIWAFVTVLGHGTWVLLAWIFGAGRRGLSTNRRPDDAETGLRDLQQQLARLAGDNTIDWETYAALRQAIELQQRRLATGVPAKVAPAPTPPATAPAVDAAIDQGVAPATDEPVVAHDADKPVEPTPTPAVPSVPVATSERVRQYAASRALAAMEAAAEPKQPPPPKQREALSRLFAAFMEEKNIRWGELVGGLLIVGCSVALVISFWSEIAARPLLKFALLGGVTAALFGVGLYTDRRWKIHATSHGLLLIATLMVPLNFLAIAAFTQGAAANDAVTLVGEAVSTVVFAILVYLAATIITPGAAALTTVGVMVPSLMQLLVRRWALPEASLATLYALAAVPVACYVATTSLVARRNAKGPALEESAANRLLAFLGVVSAATFLPLALLAWRVGPIEETIHRLSPLVVWCGVPALVTGLLFWRRMTDRRLSGVQTAGLAVGALGALVMAGAAAAAWPDPATLLPVAAMIVVAFTAVAFWFGIPAALVPAGLALAAAWLIGFHLVRGNVDWTLPDYEPMSRAIVSAESGHALVPLVGVFGLLIGMLRKVGRREDGKMIALVAAATAAASLALVLWFGFARAGDPEGATWTLAIYTVAALFAAAVVPRPAVAGVAAALLLLTLVQAIAFRWSEALALERPGIVALLAHATAMIVGLAVTAWRPNRLAHWWIPFRWWAAVSSVAAAGLLIAVTPSTPNASLAAYAAWLAAVWLGTSLLTGWALMFTAAQVAAVAAIFAGVVSAVEIREWYLAAPHPWLDPWIVQTLGLSLAGFCLVCGAVRWWFARMTARREAFVIEEPAPMWYANAGRVLNAPWPAVDHVVEALLVIALVAMSIYAAVPGVAQELAPLTAARGDAPAVRVVTPIADYELAAIDHTHAAGGGAWALGAAVVAVLVVGLAQRTYTESHMWMLPLVLAMACPLLAARWGPEVAVASALRWFVAAFFAIASVVIWWLRSCEGVNWRRIRDLLVALVVVTYMAMIAYVATAAVARVGMPANPVGLWVWAIIAIVAAFVISFLREAQLVDDGRSTGQLHPLARAAQSVLLVMAIGPLLVLFTFAVARALDQHPVVGPDPASWFRRIGWDVTYGVPLAVIALAFVGHAIVFRSSAFAFSAGLLANVVATIVVLLRLARGGGALDAAAWVVVAEVTAIVAGVVALVWIAAVRWSRAREPLLLVTQVALAAALCGAFLFPAAVQLGFEPARFPSWPVEAGGRLGWTALALAIVSAGWLYGRRVVHPWVVAYFAATAVALVALATLSHDTGNWLGYHTMLAGCCLAAWLVPLATAGINRGLGNTDARPASWSAFSARIFGIAVVVLAFRALVGDPAAPWWTIGALAAISARNVWIAWHEGGRGAMWIAAVLCNFAVSIWWIDQGHQLTATSGRGEPLEFVWINVIAAALMAVVSALVERRALAWLANARGVAYHRFAAWAIVGMLLLTTTGRLVGDLGGSFFEVSAVLGWSAWFAAFAAAAACWWDPHSRWRVACMYLVGLVAVGMYLDGLNFTAPMFHWALTMALAAYSLATSFLWSRRREIAAVLRQLRVPLESGDFTTGGGQHWLVAVNGLSAVAVVALVAWIEVAMPEFRQRIVAAYAIGAEALALALLARGVVRSSLQYSSLVLGALFAVAFAWAWLAPEMPAPWLHRTIAAIVALAVTIVVYGFGFAKLLRRENEWTRAAERLVPLLAVIAAALLIVVLTIETTAFAEGRAVPIAWPALLAVLAALVGLAAAALVAALVPGRDPLGLSERGRTAYVYAAEVLLALAFLHIRVTMPWLFGGWFMQFWPLVVMAIAFVGVGVGELFHRLQRRVLAEPLTNTGVLLPLLPALGFWVTSSEVHYSLLLLTVGVLYAAMSALRQSFWFAVLAAVAANGSLWYLLHEREGLGMAEHPQLWLIPPALCVLVAGYLNRERLAPEQSAALRYGAAIVIYASSTADIFINGVADAPWLPAVLAGLSIVGVFAGILLRVRAFLFLGITFLTVAILTVIWYAAIEQERTYILFIAGIVTGIAVLFVVGVFEKRRDDMLRLVERLKQWEQ